MKAKLAMWLDETTGSSGKTVFRRVKGKIIMARRPEERTAPFSEAQLAVQKRFRKATDYYNYVKQNPALLAQYQEVAPDLETSAYLLCRKDWYQAPEVDDVILLKYNGKVGDVIRVIVHNEIGVEAVVVTLSDDDSGALIESGNAVEEITGTGHWTYTATKSVPVGSTVAVRAEAVDYPGNAGQNTGSKKIQQ